VSVAFGVAGWDAEGTISRFTEKKKNMSTHPEVQMEYRNLKFPCGTVCKRTSKRYG